MSLYIVVNYYNYRKNVDFYVYGYTSDVNKAKQIALKEATNVYGDEVKDLKDDENFKQHVGLGGNVLCQYSIEDGYDQIIYAVVEIEEL